jgi:hypothetical protein
MQWGIQGNKAQSSKVKAQRKRQITSHKLQTASASTAACLLSLADCGLLLPLSFDL